MASVRKSLWIGTADIKDLIIMVFAGNKFNCHTGAKLLIFREIEVIVVVWGHRYIIFCFYHL